MSSRNEVAERNEAAERLRTWIPTAENAYGERAIPSDLDDALAAERRATVERINDAATVDSRIDGEAYGALRAILDEVANAQEELRTADAKAAR